MATLHFRNAKVELNGTDYSPDVEAVTLNYASEMLDETAFGDTTRIRKGGLFNWSVDITPHADFSATHWDNVIFALVGTTVCVELRPQNICSTTINPIYSGIGIVEKYTPLSGAVGTLLNTPTTIQSAGTLSRNTTAT